MIGSISGTVFAIIFDPIFLFAFKLGSAGVATANLIGFIVTDTVLFYYMIKRAKFINAKLKFIKVEQRLFNKVIAQAQLTSLLILLVWLCLTVLWQLTALKKLQLWELLKRFIVL
ncbi:hypothetical protein [Lactobacillus jensenii]|jgi:putative membrane protein|uniref:hypothetical protein n=1 Tax=Lactobacillus jensenii TaxID=109790 RepID=UPI0001C03CFB|nr:hypothetical protein [Lactobacillus jensenii]